MGKVFTKARSPFRNYNLESRVHKILDKKPVPAPRHTPLSDELKKEACAVPTADMIRKLAAEPEDNSTLSEILKKNENLVKMMDQLNIRAEGENPDMRRVLPKSSGQGQGRKFETTVYGYSMPEKTPIGKMTLSQVAEALVDHTKNPEEWTAQKISQEYKIDSKKAELLTTYFAVFDVYIPKKAGERIQAEIEKEEKLLADGKK